MLDAETYVLGIDEHTGLIINLDEENASVVGNGTVTLRLREKSFTYQSGDIIALNVLQNPWAQLHSDNSFSTTPSAPSDTSDLVEVVAPSSLEEALVRSQSIFDDALEDRDAETAVRAALDLEQALKDWSADSLQSDVADRARAALRSMISRLGDAAVTGVQDPRSIVGPYVEAMLAVRATVRAEKRYDLSDVIRDAFIQLGVEVRDTPSGVEWSLVN